MRRVQPSCWFVFINIRDSVELCRRYHRIDMSWADEVHGVYACASSELGKPYSFGEERP